MKMKSAIEIAVEWAEGFVVEKGGAGSGNFGHSGRPGRRGGSSSNVGSVQPLKDGGSLRMLEENQPLEAVLRDVTPPRGTALRNHPGLRGQSKEEREVAVISDGTDTWDVRLVQTSGTMQRVHGHAEVSLLYRQRSRYTQEEIAYMRDIGIVV